MVQEEYYQNTRPEVMELIPNEPNCVLELGCGEGVFGKALKKRYQCKVTGIELFDKAAQQAKKNLNMVFVDSLDTFDFSKLQTYDLIVANDVLEHLIDPWSVVGKLREHLSDDGFFVASIPNIQYHHILTSLLKGRWDYGDFGILDRTHLRFFTRQTAVEMFLKNGFKLYSITPINVDKVNCTNVLKRLFMAIYKDWYALQFLVIMKK
jgi:2-polyprenyl-3-methyl-5-hydroxy-6-metoxy-1,4-benzoquinol methylase